MTDEVFDRGMALRREVLGNEHVNRSMAAATDLTADFQRFITRYAWGEIWTRPGLDRRTRSCITLAMLVIGGTTSLWGAVVGALFVSALDSVLAEMEDGMTLLGRTIDLPSGSRIVVVSAIMALVVIVRPSGLTGGREFALPWLGRRRRPAEAK